MLPATRWAATDQAEAKPHYPLRLGAPFTGVPEEVAEVFREMAHSGVSHVQVGVFPNSVTGVEAFHPVLEALDQTN